MTQWKRFWLRWKWGDLVQLDLVEIIEATLDAGDDTHLATLQMYYNQGFQTCRIAGIALSRKLTKRLYKAYERNMTRKCAELHHLKSKRRPPIPPSVEYGP